MIDVEQTLAHVEEANEHAFFVSFFLFSLPYVCVFACTSGRKSSIFVLLLLLSSFFCSIRYRIVAVVATATPTHTHTDDDDKKKARERKMSTKCMFVYVEKMME